MTTTRGADDDDDDDARDRQRFNGSEEKKDTAAAAAAVPPLRSFLCTGIYIICSGDVSIYIHVYDLAARGNRRGRARKREDERKLTKSDIPFREKERGIGESDSRYDAYRQRAEIRRARNCGKGTYMYICVGIDIYNLYSFSVFHSALVRFFVRQIAGFLF